MPETESRCHVTINIHLLWCVYALAGAMAEQRGEEDELDIVEQVRQVFKRQAPEYLVMMEAAMDQDVAAVRDARLDGERGSG